VKAAITQACFHEPMVNRTYADLASHYRTAIVPARPYRPRDKAKVEVGVQIVGRWILARLRNCRFFSLAALNEAIRVLSGRAERSTAAQLGRSRRHPFEELDRPALIPLPDEPYEYAEWKSCRVNLDYHVEIAKHYDSVPRNLVQQQLEARITQKTVEIFLRGKRVASPTEPLRPQRRRPFSSTPTSAAAVTTIDQETISMRIQPAIDRLRALASPPWPMSLNCRTIPRQPGCRTPIGSASSSIARSPPATTVASRIA
jgi:transposase